MKPAYEYDNGIVLYEPWRFTSKPVWSKRDGVRGWITFIPAMVEHAGDETYYRGHLNDSKEAWGTDE